VHVPTPAEQAVQPVLVHAPQTGAVAVPVLTKPAAQVEAFTTFEVVTVQLARLVAVGHAVQTPPKSPYNGIHAVTVVVATVPVMIVHDAAWASFPEPVPVAVRHVIQVGGVLAWIP